MLPKPGSVPEGRKSAWDMQGVAPLTAAVPQECGRPVTAVARIDRKSTRRNSSHLVISYAVFCLKKKKKTGKRHKVPRQNFTRPAPASGPPNATEPICRAQVRNLTRTWPRRLLQIFFFF